MLIPRSLLLRFAFAAGLVAVLAGCVGAGVRRQAHGTSVMQFLYPREPEHVETVSVPVLSLPLRVGIAFVPPGESPGQGRAALAEAQLPQMRKAELMKQVADSFRGLPYVKAIELIPTTYLRPAGGFENLDQVKAMFNVDVIALVSYDQVQFTDQGVLSLAYWTIVGAYVVQGEKNDTQTLMETVVYDVTSRRMLFRAPGTSQVKASSTPVNASEQRRRDSATGFEQATGGMIANLKTELAGFNERVKQAPDEFKVVHKPGYTGAGAFGGWAAAAFVVLLGATAWRRR